MIRAPSSPTWWIYPRVFTPGWDSGHKFGFLAPKDAEEQLSLPRNPAPGGAGRLPRPEAAFHEVLQPPSPCCPFSSLAVKDGMELSAEVKAMSRLSESFCSWGIASAKGSRGLRSFSAGWGGYASVSPR